MGLYWTGRFCCEFLVTAGFCSFELDGIGVGYRGGAGRALTC